MNFTVPIDHRVKIKENEKRDKYLRTKKRLWHMKVMVRPIIIGVLRTIPKSLVKGVRRIGNRRMNHDDPDYSTVEISQNTEKSPGDLRRLPVTQDSSAWK